MSVRVPHPLLYKTGVYSIENTVTGKLYVGSAAKSFARRWNIHRCLLKKGCHHSKHLQAAWNKYGPEAFVFDVIVETQPEFAVSEEQYWINMLGTDHEDFGYNATGVAGSMRGFKHSAETVAEIRRRNSLWRPTADMIRRSVEGRSGYTLPESARKKISAARKARKMPWTQASRDKLAATMRRISVLPDYGRKMSHKCQSTNLQTGEVTVYPSTRATVDAGYTAGAVSRALRRVGDYPNGIHKGMRWDYVSCT